MEKFAMRNVRSKRERKQMGVLLNPDLFARVREHSFSHRILTLFPPSNAGDFPGAE
jgi:hypothetical protein